MIYQTKLIDDWSFIQHQIERSKIKRYPYKAILGESLTSYILSCRDKGMTSTETIKELYNHRSILTYLLIYPDQKDNMLKNIEISVKARYSEEQARGR